MKSVRAGFCSKLSPLAKVTNKHLLPVYNKLMIYYPLGILEPSAHGEWRPLGSMSYRVVDGWRGDAGTFDSLVRTNQLIAERKYSKTGCS